ncbi:MAG: NAD(P)/FAD-dependent oxidoreductase [Acidimicrobiales bacterium]
MLVVGAGPAGAAAAITAAGAGLETVLVDRAAFPRDKCCGDGLTAAALRLLDHLGVTPDAPSWRAIDEVEIRSPSGRIARFPLPRGRGQFSAVCRRAELDARLVDRARAAGAEVWERAACVGLRQGPGEATAELAGRGELAARWVVAADGMWSPVRRLLTGPGAYRGDWHAFRQYFSGVTGAAARRQLVWFEADLVPGYAWAFPLGDGSANVGFGVQRPRGGRRRRGERPVQDMAGLWRSLLERPHIRAALGPGAEAEGPHRAWPIPARVAGDALSLGRTLFVGDAARAPDPMTGEGIAQALATGVLAAEAIAAGGDVAARYRRRALAELAADHRLSAALTAPLRSPLGVRAAVRAAGASDWTRRNFARWLFEDYPRALLLTPGRWRRGVLHADGAYWPPGFTTTG